MAATPSLPLILAREFAANVATPFLVIDREGTLVYFNEHAERLIGSTSGDLCPLPESAWRQRFSIERLDGSEVADEESPSATARRERRPVHETLVLATGVFTRAETPPLARDFYEYKFALFETTPIE